MPRYLLHLFVTAMAILSLSIGCSQPEECEKVKQRTCEICGDDSDACRKITGMTDTAENCKKADELIDELLTEGAEKEQQIDTFCAEIAK